MKKKEGFLVVIFLLILVLALGGLIYYINNKNTKNNEIVDEYTPQEEISDEQLRKTIISLYYINKESKEIMPEARSIDVNVLIQNPYRYLIEQLMNSPKNENLEKAIPDDVKLNNVELKGDVLYVDFSKEFTNNVPEGKENEEKIIQTIVKTVTELNEVNSVRIIVDGEENQSFADNEVNFKDNFVRE